MNSTSKVLVVGLDGANWELLGPWIERGLLPRLKEMMEGGVWGELGSTIPPITGPAWVSFATGKTPGKHGCYDFLLPFGASIERRAITTRDIQAETFYELLSSAGKKCIIINLPCSYPPRIDGIILTGFLDKPSDNVFPRTLIREIPELAHYKPMPDMSLHVKGKLEQVLNEYQKTASSRFEIAKKLFARDWDFFFVLFIESDWVQHLIGERALPSKIAERSTLSVYRQLDRYIGWFLDNRPSHTNVFLMSDHGFRIYRKRFAINTWLIREGYLKDRSVAMESSDLILDRERRKHVHLINVPASILSNKRLAKPLAHIYNIVRRFLPIEPTLKIEPDPSRSLAFCVTDGGGCSGLIKINLKPISEVRRVGQGCQYESVKSEIISKLKKLRDPETGRSVFDRVLTMEETYVGEHVKEAPDVIAISQEFFIETGRFPLFYDRRPRGGHTFQGIFVASGPDIRSGIKINGAKIYDVAPTILHILGVGMTEDMDGAVLRDIFYPGTEIATRERVIRKASERRRIASKIKLLKSSHPKLV